MASAEPSPLGVFERYLSLWVALCIAAGVALGLLVPGLFTVIAGLEYASVNLVVAVFIWVMIYPMMVNVDFASLKDVGKKPKGLCITLVVNWLIKPFTMAFLAVLFFDHLFAPWIAPEDAVVDMTQEELADFEPPLADGKKESWHVFRKTSQRRSMTFVDWVGEVEAESAEIAIQTALNTFNDDKMVWAWLVVPDRAMSRSNDDDIESWFAPAATKTYKQQSQYGFVGKVRKGRSQ